MSTWQELKNNPRLKKIHDDRLKILKAIREFFWSENFVEAETPLALKLPSQEPYLNFLPVEFRHPQGEKYPFYLRTSPEFALKKLLAVGYPKIFELAKCFRNDEDFGGAHNPEFTMLEWYRSPGKLSNIMDDTEKLFKFVLKKLNLKTLRYRDQEIPISGSWERVNMREVWQRELGVDLNEYLEIEQLRNLANQRGFKVAESDEYEDLFFKIFLNEIEGKLGIKKPVFVYDYPARMCSLSAPAPDPNYAQRFELYIGGLEVANAFGELTDAEQQRTNLEKDRALRERLGRPTWSVDPDFIAAVGELPPEVGGIALGVDRMVLLCTGARDLNEVIFQNIADQLAES